MVDDEAVVLEILDTAGQDEFTAMQSQWISFGNAFIILYDVTKRASYDRARNFHHKILMVNDCDQKSQPPIILLGNKIDLVEQREIRTEEGEELAKEIGATFFETSALTDTNITEAFFEITRQIRTHYGLNPEPSHDSNKPKKEKKGGFCTLL